MRSNDVQALCSSMQHEDGGELTMNVATSRVRIVAPLFIVAFALVLSVAPASAQDERPIFTIDHYMTYQVPPITLAVTLVLSDQFGESQHSALVLERFSIPANKNDEGIIDPRGHLSWWRLLDGTKSPFRRVIVRNQFGEFELGVKDAAYLLAPALKNPTADEPPIDGKDHYKCYDVEGSALDRNFTLNDQFQQGSGVVHIPLYLCNPVKKTHLEDGTTFHVVKPTEHLVCYELSYPSTGGLGLTFRDQFLLAQISLDVVDILCVPSEKDEVVQVEDSSWGKMKSLYR